LDFRSNKKAVKIRKPSCLDGFLILVISYTKNGGIKMDNLSAASPYELMGF
jgi:hypothetical protein